MIKQLPREFSYSEGRLKYKEFDLFSLAEKYSTPLRFNDPYRLIENYNFIKELVEKELVSCDVSNEKFECGYAMKANQHHDLVALAAEHADFLEASSENDLIALESIKDKIGTKMIVCHGFKTGDSKYFGKILEAIDAGLNIIPVVDSIEELHAFRTLDRKIQIGLRLATVSYHEGHTIYERFGITFDEIQSNLELFSEATQLEVVMLHVHVSNTIKDIQQRIDDMSTLFTLYKQLSQSGHQIKYFNCGGGLPVRSMVDESFYSDFYARIFDKLLDQDQVEFPIVMTEAGRFLAQESQFLVLEVVETKRNNPNFTWLILNGSAINLIPETMLDQSMKFNILPVKDHDTETVKAICAGITCDPEDYFHRGILELPKPPPDERAYIIIPNTGAYQESLLGSARGGHGHCLVEGPKELTLSEGIITETQNPSHFLGDLKYKNT